MRNRLISEVFIWDEVVFDAVIDGDVERGDFFLVAGFSEFGDIGFCVVLVFGF